MTPEEFEALSEAKKAEAIFENDEHVRLWRGVCQLCGESLQGTRKQLREHKCDKSSK